MKLSVKQLKQLIRESVEEMELSLPSDQDHDQLASIYSDVYKERYGILPRHMDFSKYSTEELQKMVDDMEKETVHHARNDYSHEEEMEDLIDQHGHEADEAEREFMAAKKEDELMRTPEEGEELPQHSGMGRRLAESLKLVIREALEEEAVDECGSSYEEQAVVEELMEKKMGFKKLTKSLAAKGAKDPKALAYWIGKKKLGKKEMTKRAVAGKKKASK